MLSANPSTGIAGQPVTLTATVSPDTAQNHTATGTVTFYNNYGAIGSAPVSGGLATLSGSVLPAGTQTLTATYSGDFNFAANLDGYLVYTVKPNATVAPLFEPVGTTSAVQTATLTLTAGGTLGSIAVLTQGTANLDFNLSPGPASTCTQGTSYAAGATCTVEYTFTPLRPGIRQGAVVLRNSSGSPLGTTYIQGTGTGPQVNYSPGTLKALPITLQTYPFSMVADAAGSLYLSLAASDGSPENVVLKETPNGSGYTQTIVASNLAFPQGVAVDGAGNVYIADQDNYTVYKETLVNGAYVQSRPFGSTTTLQGIAVDGSGNVYLATNGQGLLEEVYSGGSYTQVSVSTTDVDCFLAVDGNGVIYCGSGTTYTPQAGGGFAKGTFPGGLGMAVDDLGNIFASVQFQYNLYKYTLSNGSYSQGPLLASGVRAVALDGSGNLFFTANNTIMELDYADPPTLTFATTAVGSTSSDSPKPVTIYNEGNAPLVITAPGSQSNPHVSEGYSIGSNSTCPLVIAAAVDLNAARRARCRSASIRFRRDPTPASC